MHWERIVHFRPDSFLFKKGTQLVALRRSHGELIIDMKVSVPCKRKCDAIRMLRPGKQLLIPFGVLTSPLGPLVKILQFDLENGSLEGVQSAIDPYRLVQIADLTPVNSKHGHGIGKGLVV